MTQGKGCRAGPEGITMEAPVHPSLRRGQEGPTGDSNNDHDRNKVNDNSNTQRSEHLQRASRHAEYFLFRVTALGGWYLSCVRLTEKETKLQGNEVTCPRN